MLGAAGVESAKAEVVYKYDANPSAIFIILPKDASSLDRLKSSVDKLADALGVPVVLLPHGSKVEQATQAKYFFKYEVGSASISYGFQTLEEMEQHEREFNAPPSEPPLFGSSSSSSRIVRR